LREPSRSALDAAIGERYAAPMSTLAVGELAPEFDVLAHDGTRVRLSDLAGKHVLLWFYPEADTPG